MSIFPHISSADFQAKVAAMSPRVLTWFQARKTHPADDRYLAIFDKQAVFSASTGFDPTDVRTQVLSILDKITAELDVFKSSTPLTVKSITSFTVRLIHLILPVINSLPVDSAERKKYALVVVDEFYYRVIAPLDIPYIPNFIENSIIDPLIGNVWHEVASGLYDALDALLSDPQPTA